MKSFLVVLALLVLSGCTGSNAGDAAKEAAATAAASVATLPAPSAGAVQPPSVEPIMGAPMVVASEQAGNELDRFRDIRDQQLAEVNDVSPGAKAGEVLKITVHKNAGCTCCEAWIKTLEADGFFVIVDDNPDMASVKNRFGIPANRQSCHTGEIDGMFVEGHVPAQDIRRLVALKKQGKAPKGIAVPGMPAGSPGMEMGGVHEKYDVYAIDGSKETVFASH